jgi:diguanylate cyclase (GGDEF)-like protein/PAS domain S-box-containing protein
MMLESPDPVHVLLVEDNAGDAHLVEELLAELATPSFTLTHVVRLSEARREIARGVFDVVLLDLGLPDARGMETVRGIQEAGGRLPLVVLTGLDDTSTGMEAIHHGVQDFLPKGELSEQLLGRALRYAIERHRLEEEQRLWAKAFEASEPMMITDRSGVILGVNSAFTAVTGYSADEAIGVNPRSLLRSDHHDGTFFQAVWDQVHREGHWAGEIWNRRRNGETFPGHESITAVSDTSGRVNHYVAVLQDITDRKRLEMELEQLATHDRLTGVLNRGRLEELLDHERSKAERYGGALSVILFDIDLFKQVNDTFGHGAGDTVLRELAHRAGESLRRSDRLGRWGGEEFMVLLPESTAEGARHVAEKLRTAVSATAFDTVGQVTISLGIAAFRPGDTVDTLADRADRALYLAKAAGRDQVAMQEDEGTAARSGRAPRAGR